MPLADKSKPLILLIEDDAPLRSFLYNALTDAGYRLQEAVTGHEALEAASHRTPDLVMLDLGLPDIDGQVVLRELRQWLKAPIIVLSARHQEAQKVEALDHGADDYLTKPFSTAELLARLRVALRHAAGPLSGTDSPIFEQGAIKVDLSAHRVYVAGSEVHLTPIEFKLLATLIRSAGKVLTHKQLLKEVWGPDRVEDTHYLRVFMAALRRKLEDDPAQPRYLGTEPGVGYRFAVE
jgi:two-component system KDP operon response regulator KdpE